MHTPDMNRFTMDTPIVFSDGSEVYSRLAAEYIRHDRGLFILAPSGSGKTHYVKHQTEKHWIDGDDLWVITNADLTHDEWDTDPEIVQEVNRRCDVITYQSKKLGFWVIGSSNSSLKPDAIVLPPWDKHVKMIQQREYGNYDGGAKAADLGGVQAHREWIEQWTQQDVPRFESIEDAVTHLTNDIAL